MQSSQVLEKVIRKERERSDSMDQVLFVGLRGVFSSLKENAKLWMLAASRGFSKRGFCLLLVDLLID